MDAQSGRITRILLAISEYSAQTFADAIPRVLARLPAGAELDILVSQKVRPQVSAWLDEAGPGAPVCLIEAPEDLAFSLWIQDLFLARKDRTLLIPPHFDRYKDLEAARLLAAGAKCQIAEARHYFEGGNIIAAGDWLLIGADIVTQASCEPAKLACQIDPARRPIILSTETPVDPEVTEPTDRPAKGWTQTLRWKIGQVSRQPMFHIDLFIAPAGTTDDGAPRFLVGCPRQAAEVLGHPLWPHALADQFDEIATQLTNAGADVIRNPLPLIWKDHIDNRHRTWFHLPVNNVLVEDLGPGGRTVWLPGFASSAWSELAEIDNRNAAIWSMLGYSVIRIPGMMPLAENLGSLWCMAKVIARKES